MPANCRWDLIRRLKFKGHEKIKNYIWNSRVKNSVNNVEKLKMPNEGLKQKERSERI